MSIWRMTAHPIKGWVAVFLLALVLCGCGAQHPGEISRIALLAPFEGRYREIGYDAYYAARLAIHDAGAVTTELLAVDDGGSVERAVERAKALSQDPLVKTIIAMGYAATDEQTQKAFGDLPVLIVGQWGVKPASSHIFILENAHASDFLNAGSTVPIINAAEETTPLTGGAVFALRQFPFLRSDTSGITIESSGTPPDDNFRQRYVESGQFVPEPGLLATLTYDAANIALQAADSTDAQHILETLSYTGLNGLIRFENGYWADAPIHFYCYKQPTAGDSGGSTPVLAPCAAQSH